MAYYRIKLKHDGGTVNITVCASSSDLARFMVMESEGCPAGAIVKITQIKKIY